MDSFLKKFFPKILAKAEAGTANNYCKYDNQELQTFTSSLYIAGLVATFGAGYTSRRFGRLLTMRVAAISFVVGTVLCASAPSLGLLIFGRVVLGFGVGFANQVNSLFDHFTHASSPLSRVKTSQLKRGQITVRVSCRPCLCTYQRWHRRTSEEA